MADFEPRPVQNKKPWYEDRESYDVSVENAINGVEADLMDVQDRAGDLEAAVIRPEILNATGESALNRVHAALINRNVVPCRIVTFGSSTIFGDGASYGKTGISLVRQQLQGMFPSALGSEAPHLELGSAVRAEVGVQTYRGAVSGSVSSNYISVAALTTLDSVAPAIVFHQVGSNDYSNGVHPSTVAENILNRIDAIDARPFDAPVHVVFHQHRRKDVISPAYPWSLYGAELAKLAAAHPDRVVFVDLDLLMGAAGVPLADKYGLLSSDNVHLTDQGHAVYAAAIVKALRLDGLGHLQGRWSEVAGRVLYLWDAANNRDQRVLGETGLRDVSALLPGWSFANTGRHARMSRSGNTVRISIFGTYNSAGNFSMPAGFQNSEGSGRCLAVRNADGTPTQVSLLVDLSTIWLAGLTVGQEYSIRIDFLTTNAWPTTLPGTAVGTIPNL